MPEYAVFINYRTEDTDLEAHLLFRRLSARFGASKVFMAGESIEGGVDYRSRMMDALAGSSVVVALIGDRWLSAAGTHGTRRLDDADDWVRVELETALRRQIPILPVRVGNAKTLAADELPGSLADLAYRQTFPLSNSDFDGDADRLADRIQELLRSVARPEPEPVPDGWNGYTVTGVGCSVRFALPPRFVRIRDHWRDRWTLRLQPREVWVSVQAGPFEAAVSAAEQDPLAVEREDVRLPAGDAVRVRRRKPWFKPVAGGGGQLTSFVTEQNYVPVDAGRAAYVLLTCTTAPRRIAEQAPLFLAIARTIDAGNAPGTSRFRTLPGWSRSSATRRAAASGRPCACGSTASESSPPTRRASRPTSAA